LVAGYVGVIDERLDLELVADLAAALPDWELRIVGPVAKIPTGSLPQAGNLTYPGFATYAALPEVMAGFDVALMPFALNEATRSISPTKTLEYLAAGLPVVSTRVPDVVAGFADIVQLADTGTEFAQACRQAVERPSAERERLERLVRRTTRRHEWDVIAHEMGRLMADPPSWSQGYAAAEARA
jgi:glycosyltransferase involved in cell wall biosynthesis